MARFAGPILVLVSEGKHLPGGDSVGYTFQGMTSTMMKAVEIVEKR